ncbi:alcohol dehydrogenase-like [Battus philenor]|uniref:alcohol dehydrogenase-like n=1 Tax=Battus philenor TaxID=42288 RepID=UPI0035CF8382
MERDLQNKTVVITGGVSGIGLSIVETFLEKNVKAIIILDIDETSGKQVQEKMNAEYGKNKVIFYKCDVTKDLDVIYEKIMNDFKTVDVLVNSAGVADEITPKRTIDLNVTAVVEWSFKFWDHMRKDRFGRGGTIMNLASISGFKINPFSPVYQASKFAVMGFTRSLGHEYNYSKFGVRVVAICPGFTETPLCADVKLRVPEMEKDLQLFMRQNPWQKPEAVGKAAMDVFETADSGTAWEIENSRPISQVLYTFN